MEANMTKCSRCGQEWARSEFYKSKQDKVLQPCKTCKRAYYKKWLADHPNYHNEYRQKKPKKVKPAEKKDTKSSESFSKEERIDLNEYINS
jgi:predicted  nucleic acid-binding Zn-ribbon protein